MLKDDQPFNEERYARKLSELKPDPLVEQYRNDHHNQLINDTIDELKDWSCFKKGSSSKDDHMEEEPVENTHTLVKEHKTGRNYLCPCGSGKKYKKCCGK